MVMNPHASAGEGFQSLDGEDPLEKEMATQYSCLGNPMDREAQWAIYSPWGCERVKSRT